MNKILRNLILIIFAVITSSASCKKEKTGIDGLPAATQTGENTFGCMVNGVLFIPKEYSLGKQKLESSYTLSELSQYHFKLVAVRRDGDLLSNLNIHSYVSLKEGLTIELIDGRAQNNASASYFLNGSNEYRTTSQIKGEMKITHFDVTKRIISGTFWFDGVNEQGEKKEVREGRFDVIF